MIIIGIKWLLLCAGSSFMNGFRVLIILHLDPKLEPLSINEQKPVFLYSFLDITSFIRHKWDALMNSRVLGHEPLSPCPDHHRRKIRLTNTHQSIYPRLPPRTRLSLHSERFLYILHTQSKDFEFGHLSIVYILITHTSTSSRLSILLGEVRRGLHEIVYEEWDRKTAIWLISSPFLKWRNTLVYGELFYIWGSVPKM